MRYLVWRTKDMYNLPGSYKLPKRGATNGSGLQLTEDKCSQCAEPVVHQARHLQPGMRLVCWTCAS